MLNITHNQDNMAALRYENNSYSWACGLKADGSYFISRAMGASGGGGTDKLVLTDTTATFAGTVSDSKGDLRKIPQQNEQGSAHTLVAADAGKHILADATVTIPNNIFSTGDAVTIVNASGSEITLTSQLSSYLYNSGTAAEGSKKLAARGMATIIFLTATGAYISGSGLSDA